MSSRSLTNVIALGGFVAVIIGFFLPWGPSGPTNIRWGTQMKNEAGSDVSFYGTTLADGETAEGGPAGTVKITSAQGRVRVIAGTYMGKGTIWYLGYLALLLGVCGGISALVGLVKPERAALAANVLLTLSSLGFAVIVCRVVRMLCVGYSLSSLLAYHAPFGRWQCSAGFILAAIGFVTALSASILMKKRGFSVA
jgi:hypothetical protein